MTREHRKGNGSIPDVATCRREIETFSADRFAFYQATVPGMPEPPQCKDPWEVMEALYRNLYPAQLVERFETSDEPFPVYYERTSFQEVQQPNGSNGDWLHLPCRECLFLIKPEARFLAEPIHDYLETNVGTIVKDASVRLDRESMMHMYGEEMAAPSLYNIVSGKINADDRSVPTFIFRVTSMVEAISHAFIVRPDKQIEDIAEFRKFHKKQIAQRILTPAFEAGGLLDENNWPNLWGFDPVWWLSHRLEHNPDWIITCYNGLHAPISKHEQDQNLLIFSPNGTVRD